MKIVSLLSIVLFFTSCKGNWDYLIENYPEDNALEEFVEHQIEKQTGWEIDLTPSSPEKKD